MSVLSPRAAIRTRCSLAAQREPTSPNALSSMPWATTELPTRGGSGSYRVSWAAAALWPQAAVLPRARGERAVLLVSLTSLLVLSASRYEPELQLWGSARVVCPPQPVPSLLSPVLPGPSAALSECLRLSG